VFDRLATLSGPMKEWEEGYPSLRLKPYSFVKTIFRHFYQMLKLKTYCRNGLLYAEAWNPVFVRWFCFSPKSLPYIALMLVSIIQPV